MIWMNKSAHTPSWRSALPLLLFLSVTGLADADTLNLEGFVPVETVEPDWSARSADPYYDGMVVYGGKSFVCEGVDGQDYAISMDVSGRPKPVVTLTRHEKVPPDLPQTVRTALADISGEIAAVKSLSAFNNPVDIEPWADGWMVAFAYGEFGGGLVHVSESGEAKVVDSANSNDLLRVGDLLYVGSGLNHLSLREGKISIFGHVPNKLSAYEIPAPSAVYGLAEHDGYVVGQLSRGLIEVEADGTVTYQIGGWSSPYKEEPDWIGFSPRSIGILPSGQLWLGGENVLAVYGSVPVSGEPQIYIPETCRPDFGQELDRR